MGIEERRHREKEQRRNDILDAAEQVFFAKGIDVATMDEVAQTAELSKGTLYLYFKSKEDLYLGVNVRALEKLYEVFTAAIDPGATGMQQILRIGDAYFQFAREYPNYFETLLYFEAESFDDNDPTESVHAYTERRRKMSYLVRDTVKRGIEDGSVRSDLEAPFVSLFLWATSGGMIQSIAKKSEMIRAIHGIEPLKLQDVYFHLIKRALGGD